MKTKLFSIVILFYGLFSSGNRVQAQVAEERCSGSVGCDTVAIVQKISPWRLGLYAGPAFAYCGSWENTFNTTNYRDKSLYNGAGLEVDLNADYFFNKKNPSSQVKFGLGGVLGYHKFFFRKDLDDYLNLRVLSAGLSPEQALIRKNGSEDFYLVVGPVLNVAFTKKPRSPFVEASVRGGGFRTTPAAILVTGQATGQNIYTVTASDRRYHPGLFASLGIFFPLKNTWALGLQATGFRTRVNYDFPADQVWSFERKHGGFSAGISLRKGFVRSVAERKDPTPAPVCLAPELEVLVNGQSIAGKFFRADNALSCDSIQVRWKSRSDSAKNETFTARIHRVVDGVDDVIGQVICKPQTSMSWPVDKMNDSGCPLPGQYYVTVQSHQTTPCSSCISDVSTTGFGFVQPDTLKIIEKECLKQCFVQVYAYERVKTKRIKYGKSPTSCEGCICPVDTISSYRSVYHELGSYTLQNCENPNLDEEIKKIKVPAWAKTVYVNVEKIQVGTICPNPGRRKSNYKATVKKGKVGAFYAVD
jgi:hypothetical protein